MLDATTVIVFNAREDDGYSVSPPWPSHSQWSTRQAKGQPYAFAVQYSYQPFRLCRMLKMIHPKAMVDAMNTKMIERFIW